MSVTVSVNDHRQEKIKLRTAILIYEEGKRAIATVHPVEVDDKGVAAILAGRPMTGAGTRALVRRFAAKRDVPAYLPERLLAQGLGSFVWYEPPQKRHITFSADSALRVGQQAKVLMTPGVIFAAGRREWQVFAYVQQGRPTPATRLFVPPFFNCYEDGGICAGNVELPSRDLVEPEAVMQQWSDAFFRSKFTHPAGDAMTTHRQGLDGLWFDMLQGERKAITAKDMRPTAKTLNDLIRDL